MKALKNLFYWVVLPGVFGASIAFSDHQLALVGSSLLWAVALVFGPLALIALLALLTIKPTDPKWAKNKATVLGGKPGVIRRLISWIALLTTVMLCAYAGFVITAVFYFIGSLWCKLVYTILVHHFENAENAQA